MINVDNWSFQRLVALKNLIVFVEYIKAKFWNNLHSYHKHQFFLFFFLTLGSVREKDVGDRFQPLDRREKYTSVTMSHLMGSNDTDYS